MMELVVILKKNEYKSLVESKRYYGKPDEVFILF